MLNEPKIIWSIDWGKIDRKNWAEKERAYYENKNKEEYEFFVRRLAWFQGKNISELLGKDLTRIGKNKHGHKLNFKVYKKTIRIFGYLENGYQIFHPLLFLVKKTNKVTLKDLNTFEERIKKYEK
ncbi:hypothetical protein HYZ82_03420 [Candidatus Nomurabacteria bacterium]|nr:hypothetical protein [Candidatus Nomurabacteria bacterium]